MKTYNRYLLVILIFSLLVISNLFADDQVMFNYQGRVRVNGNLFNGTGLFKFAIVSKPQEVSLWSNDMTSLNGEEPKLYVSAIVEKGIFNIMIGDPLIGMEPINRSIFNNPCRIKLRIWFSDGVHGFQRLLPDHNLINIDLLGIRTGIEDFSIYVNCQSGNDDNSGLTTPTAKRTIQGAVDVLPERIRCNITIDIADGVYREEVKVFGISVEEGKTLLFLGDENWTPDSSEEPKVRITGNDDDISKKRVRTNCFFVRKCSIITVKGILFDNAIYSGFHTRESTCNLENCKATSNTVGEDGAGYLYTTSSFGEVVDCVADGNDLFGFEIANFSGPIIKGCRAINNVHSGVYIAKTATVSFYHHCIFSDNMKYGLKLEQSGRACFIHRTYSGAIWNNGLYGIDIETNSYTMSHTRNDFKNNTLGEILISTGGNTY